MQTAKLFENGRSQAVRLPKKFRFEGKQVYIKQVGDAVILLPYHQPWNTLFESLDNFSQDFMSTRQQPPTDTRENPFE